MTTRPPRIRRCLVLATLLTCWALRAGAQPASEAERCYVIQRQLTAVMLELSLADNTLYTMWMGLQDRVLERDLLATLPEDPGQGAHSYPNYAFDSEAGIIHCTRHGRAPAAPGSLVRDLFRLRCHAQQRKIARALRASPTRPDDLTPPFWAGAPARAEFPAGPPDDPGFGAESWPNYTLVAGSPTGVTCYNHGHPEAPAAPAVVGEGASSGTGGEDRVFGQGD